MAVSGAPASLTELADTLALERRLLRVTDLSLELLATRAPEPLRAAFADHHDGLLELVNQIERVTMENRRLATVNLDAIKDTLGIATGTDPSGTYDGMGRRAGLICGRSGWIGPSDG